MKKIITFFVLAFSLASLAACAAAPEQSTTQQSSGAETTSTASITVNPPGDWTVETADDTDVTQDPASVNIYLVALGDKGASGPVIGCDDSLVGVQVKYTINRTENTAKDALTKLFAVKDQYYGSSGLYNALYNSDLKVESLTADDSKKASLKLSGTYTLGGMCDNPRFEEQIKATVLQFGELYSSVEIFINDKPLNEILSLKE